MALVPDLPLPVSAGIRCTTIILEAGELIKTGFERCRFLLPVSSYEGLKISGGVAIFGGKILESHSSEVVRSASVQRVLGVLKHIARSEIPGHRKLVEFAYENAKKNTKNTLN